MLLKYLFTAFSSVLAVYFFGRPGAQVVKAPMPPQSTKGKSTVKTGNDLRNGGK